MHASPSTAQIMQLATGYWASATLLAANDLGVFSVLAGEPLTAAEVAKRIESNPRATEMLLDACCGLGLAFKQGEKYSLSDTSNTLLVPGRPGYLGSAITYARDQYELWGRLAGSVRSGAPAADPDLHLGDDPSQTRAYVHGMHERAVGIARRVIDFLDLEGAQSLLDVGGGPGTYSCLLAEKYPGLRATVLDLPGITAVARELVQEQGLSDRVTFVPCDATLGDYGESVYDAVLFSGVLHQMAPSTILRMFRGARRALADGGKVVISDVMSDAAHTQPVFSTLFSLQMLLASKEGAVFSSNECEDWLADAGFRDIQPRALPSPLPYTVVSARK